MPLPAPIPQTVRRIAEVSLDAIRANLGALGGPGVAVDLRADAYGHGLELVTPALIAAGVREFVVSPDIEIGPDSEFGHLLASSRARAVVEPRPGARVVGPELFGLTDRALQPAMRFIGEVLGLKRLRAGEGVSYGYSYRPERDTTLALIGIGYAHGGVRRAMNRCRVLVGVGQHVIAGAISMDQFSVDLDGKPDVRVGDDAVLFGDPARGEPHVLDWQDATGIPAAAITSRIADVVLRVAVGTVSAVDGRPDEHATEPDVVTGTLHVIPQVAHGPARRAAAHVSLESLRHNVERLAATVAPARTMLVVKSDAYGHDLLPCVHAGLEAGATSLGALEIGAGLALRDAGIHVPLFAWMHGAQADFRGAIERTIDLGASAVWQLDAIAAAGESADSGTAHVHLKIDTGLRRSGANPEDWPALVSRAVELQRAGKLRIRAAWTHLSDTSFDEDHRSLDRFDAAVDEARSLGAEFELLHAGASSVGIDYPRGRFDVVRFGIAAYGISPFHDRSGRDLGLIPVMTFTAPVTDVRDGVATIAAGYGDGMQCLAGSEPYVQLGGTRARVLTVGPDSATIDVSSPGASGVAVGDQVTVFGTGDGGEPTAEAWAHWSDTVGDELVTGVTSRVPRVLTGVRA